MAALQATDRKLFFSKNDPEDPRLGDLVRTELSPESCVQIFGWPDDEGIRMNGGRPGAAEAPDQIRRVLYKMTPHLDFPGRVRLADRGNLRSAGENLPARHQMARSLVSEALERQDDVLCLGGGHDYGFPDAAAFLEKTLSGHPKERPLVVNFDAHLDVRPAQKGFHSGTPFRRLLEEFGGRFDFFEIGLQPQCNSRNHWLWALDQGATLWSIADIKQAGSLRALLEKSGPARQARPCWISLDIDALSSSSAPGCSQSWDTGLQTSEVFDGMSWLHEHFEVRGLGIYEVSPPLDQDDRTSKLAALFAHDFIGRRSSGRGDAE